MRIALAQINPTVGAIEGNARAIAGWIARAHEAGADLVLTPELAMTAYPPRDLLLREGFVERAESAADALGAAAPPGVTVIVGTPRRDADGRVRNALLAYRDGRRVGVYDKRLLPNYDVFDERRYFRAGEGTTVLDVAGVRVGLAVCEDAWAAQDVGLGGYYDGADPIADTAEAGASVIAVASASPFVVGKGRRQRAILADHARRHRVHLAVVNQVGGNDELVFDGHGAVFTPEGALAAAAPLFCEHLLVADIGAAGAPAPDPVERTEDHRLILDALVLGVRDYVRKTGHRRVLVGLSGGIDSSVTAVVAALALGADAVTGVLMPGPFSSTHSVTDATDLAQRLGVRTLTVPIGPALGGFESAMGDRAGPPGGLVGQNLQARCRGMVLMALSNAGGGLVLATGNKSELATGYCTLYGDMCGALAVLSDLVKRRVYALARLINARHRDLGLRTPPIPPGVLTKAPSAELAPGQTDQDVLPPYDVLDEIVERYVEGGQSVQRIVEETGLDADLVRASVRMIDTSEFKRVQMATGIKVTPRAFGIGWRQPVARGW